MWDKKRLSIDQITKQFNNILVRLTSVFYYEEFHNFIFFLFPELQN